MGSRGEAGNAGCVYNRIVRTYLSTRTEADGTSCGRIGAPTGTTPSSARRGGKTRNNESRTVKRTEEGRTFFSVHTGCGTWKSGRCGEPPELQAGSHTQASLVLAPGYNTRTVTVTCVVRKKDYFMYPGGGTPPLPSPPPRTHTGNTKHSLSDRSIRSRMVFIPSALLCARSFQNSALPKRRSSCLRTLASSRSKRAALKTLRSGVPAHPARKIKKKGRTRGGGGAHHECTGHRCQCTDNRCRNQTRKYYQ